ncbi:hypothetical protein GCM10008013_44800 [Paenibacillus segetis]|uniref:DUF4129 domain-containing protein n=1 Tax=Paenibacillus segetis TaxID=1325360 RepID=A0ABQ1YUT4_9BACL|nr:hypothetical protein GCM10008013_44800 [Paenibacillus segetis]
MQGMTVGTRLHEYKLYGWGVILYLVSGLLFPRFQGLASWMPLLTWTGVATLVLTLFIMNEGHLRYSTLSGESEPMLPRRLRRHNRIYMTAIVIAAMLLAAGAGKWLSSVLWGFVKMVVGWLTRTSPQEPEQIQEEVTDIPQMEPFLPQDVKPPGMLSQILNILAYVVGAAIVAGLLVLLIYWLYKNVGGIWRKSIDSLLGLLRRRGQEEQNTSYRDEEKNIFSWDRVSKKLQDFRSPLSWIGRRTERWEDMTDNRERVRYLYRRLLHSELGAGYELKPHLTPIEQEREFNNWLEQDEPKKISSQAKSIRGKRGSSSEPLVSLYYRVRYGAERPNDKEVANIKEKMNL